MHGPKKEGVVKSLRALLISGICLWSVTVVAGASTGMDTEVEVTNGWLVKSSSRQKMSFSKYKVVGVFQQDDQFIGGSAMANVMKQVEFEFSWPLNESSPPPRVLANIPTKAENSRDGSGVCPAPILKGTYEHFELKAITVIGNMFGLVGERRTPDMTEYVGGGGCKGTHPVQGQVREEQLLVTLPAEFFAGEIPKGRAITQQEQEWTWTFISVP
jgi:hypothetical protein